VDGALADGGGLAGGGRIDGTAGEVGAGARLAGLPVAAARRLGGGQQITRGGGGTLVRQVACGDLRKVATKCVSRCLTE
jgi:hypothetical protein